ncbi:MAG: ABC transporter ATP-binding protein/permease [Bacilli bacterium]|nr:ABC transporter ATP-binding protein/permease [Bacilli bacterium]
MFKFLKRLKSYWWLVILIIVLTCAQVVFDFLLPSLMGEIIKMIQDGSSGVNMQEVVLTAIQMILVALASGVMGVATCTLASKVTAKMMARVRYELYTKIGQFSENEMNKYSVSSLITRTTNDITNVSNTYVLLFRFMLYGPLLAVGAFVFLLTDPDTCRYQLFLVIAGAVLLLALIIFAVVRLALPRFSSMQKRIDKVNLITKENLEGLRVVRAYNAESYQEEKFTNVNESLTKDDKFANRALGFLMPGIQLTIGLMMIAITLVSSHLIKDGQLEYPKMTVIIQFAGLLLTGFVLMVIILVMIPRSTICAKRINEVIETEIQIKDNKETERYNEVGTVEFKDVSFTYPGGGAPSLKKVSFKVNKGETLAFIGATGSGKTTLLNLIQRFYDTSVGQVLVDGLDVKKYKLDDLYKKFGYVPQKPYLFHDTLRNNVCLGVPNATDEELKEALDISQSNEFVSKLTNGINYEISQGGKNVSGGQRQRLSIARAIITKPEIFIFDDSFSALDYKTDKVLRGEIKKRCKGVTNIIVAQRVGTIMDADQIIVLDNGNMVGKGTHKELLKNCKVYKEIALSQLSKEELA